MYLKKWLQDELHGWRLIFWPTVLLIAFLLYSSIFLNILQALGISMPHGQLLNPQSHWNEYVIMHFLFVSLIEDFAFRFVPLVIAVRLKRTWVLYSIIIISSMTFGFIHGNLLNIMYQGVAGIVLSIIFLKSGGMNKKTFKPFLICIISHTSYNLLTAIVS